MTRRGTSFDSIVDITEVTTEWTHVSRALKTVADNWVAKLASAIDSVEVVRTVGTRRKLAFYNSCVPCKIGLAKSASKCKGGKVEGTLGTVVNSVRAKRAVSHYVNMVSIVGARCANWWIGTIRTARHCWRTRLTGSIGVVHVVSSITGWTNWRIEARRAVSNVRRALLACARTWV